MIHSEDIVVLEDSINIPISAQSASLKGINLSGEKQPVLVYSQGFEKAQEVLWNTTTAIGKTRYLSFARDAFSGMVPIPSSELSACLRSRALTLIGNLAKALQNADAEYKGLLAWTFSSLPLSSFYFLEDGSVVLFPAQISELIDALACEEDRFPDKLQWYAHNCVSDFGKVNFLCQLLYYSISAAAPFGSEDVRNGGFKAVPLECQIRSGEKAKALARFIDNCLGASKKYQYDAKEAYSYFLKNYSALTLDLAMDEIEVGDNEEYARYLEHAEKKARFNTFMRKKGAILIAALAVLVAIIWIAAFYIKIALTPPETKDMNQEEIIEFFFSSMTAMDDAAMSAPLAKGYKNPFEFEIASMFVTKQMRLAYESVQAYMDANQWIADGMPAIRQTTAIFGVTDLEIKQISDNVFLASSFFYTPKDYINYYENDEEEDENAMSKLIYKYRQVYEFSFEMEKDWYVITNIEEKEFTLVETYDVPYYEAETNFNTSALMSGMF